MRLGVNIDHVASVRELRKGIEPEPAYAAMVCQSAGADSIVVHLREDRRHIKDRDLCVLREIVRIKLNLEMSIAGEIVDIACRLRPDQATFVPERRQEITTEGGLDVVSHFKKIREAARRLEQEGIEVSLFIDPDEKQIDAAKKSGVKMVEFHTGRYANAKDTPEREKCLKEIERCARYARAKHMLTFAGHGLDYYNVLPVCAIKGIEELNIGYSIVCRAVIVGLHQAVREMKELIG